MASRWLCPGNRTFLEVDIFVFSWWIGAFLRGVAYAGHWVTDILRYLTRIQLITRWKRKSLLSRYKDFVLWEVFFKHHEFVFFPLVYLKPANSVSICKTYKVMLVTFLVSSACYISIYCPRVCLKMFLHSSSLLIITHCYYSFVSSPTACTHGLCT